MKLSTRSLYGLRMMYHLAVDYQKGPLQLSEIAAREGISEKYLGQIVLLLRGSGLLGAVRGAQGGYLLARAPQEMTILQIVECLEGELLGTPDNENTANACSDTDSQCAADEIWARLHKAVYSTLGGITLDDMTKIPMTKNRVIDYAI